MGSYKKLSVFDFDGTLLDTPTKEIGVAKYKEKTGKEWPYQGWWGRAESLDGDIFDIDVIQSVKSAYEIERKLPETMVIMLTGRIPRLGKLVESLLNRFGFKFDGYYYNMGGSTDVSKIKTLTDLLEKHKSIIEVEMFDDKESHVIVFETFFNGLVNSGRLKSFKVNLVKNDLI